MPRWVVGVSLSCQLSGWDQEHSEGVRGTLVVAHPATENIKISSSGIVIDLRSHFGSSFIGFDLFGANLLATLLLRLFAEPRADDEEEELQRP